MLEFIVILVATVALLLPIKHELWPKIRPVIAILALSLLLVPLTPGNVDHVNVRIQSSPNKNAAAEGNEIYLMSVAFDGVEQDLNEIFPDNKWQSMDGRLVWRNYDKGSETAIYGEWPKADEYEITFQKNRWRGIVEVQIDNEIYTVDCYSPELYELETLTIPGPKTGIQMSKLAEYAIMVAVLVLICVLLPLLTKVGDSTKAQTRDPGPVKRNSWSDLLRLIAVIFIVLIGASGGLYETNGIQEPSNMAHLVLYVFESFAIPVFFMLTGGFLLRRDENPIDTLQKRVPSVLVPVITLIAIILMTSGYVMGSGLESVLDYLNRTLFSTDAYLLQFMIILVVLYLLAPCLRPIFVSANQQTKIYTMVLLCVAPSVAYTIISLVGLEGSALSIAMLMSCVGQFCLGAFLEINEERIGNNWKKPLAAIVGGLLASVAIQYYIRSGSGVPAPSAFGSGAENVLYAAGLFALFMAIAPTFDKMPYQVRNFIKKASSLAIGILLIQSLLIRRVPVLSIFGTSFEANSSSLGKSFFVGLVYVVLSLAVSYIISTIPIFRRIIGLDWYTANDKKKAK